MTYLQELELQLQTAERIEEQMQHSRYTQMFFVILAVLLAILMVLLDNTLPRVLTLILIFWALYWQYQEYKALEADYKILVSLIDRAELLLRNPALDMSILSKEVYKLRINRLKP